MWDLPGGHVEGDEAPADTLVRELLEELGVVIDRPSHSPHQTLTVDDAELDVFVVDDWTGEPTNLAPEEHDEIRWVRAAELERLSLADPRYHDLLRDIASPA